MRVRLGVAGAAAAVCVAVCLLLVSSATSAAPKPSKPGPIAHIAGFDNNYAVGTITNLTPYTWTYVDNGGIGSDTHPQARFSPFPTKLKPGQSFVYRLNYTDKPHGTTWDYDGWFTYRAVTVSHPEYLTLSLFGGHCTGICSGSETRLAVQAHNTTAAPAYQNGVINFGPDTPNPEITGTSGGRQNVWSDGTTADFDWTFEVKGNFTLDASQAGGQQVGDLLNAMCAGVKDTSCKFTAAGPLTWTLGPVTTEAPADNVDCSVPPSGEPPPTGQPPADDPDYHGVSVTESREAALSVNASLSTGVEVDVFNAVEAGVSAEFGVEREWSDTTAITKTVRILLPRDWIGGVWIAPVVAKVSGTLQVSTHQASYTITNFQETKDGVSPNDTTAPYDVITYTRPLTMDEWTTEKRSVCT